MPYYRVSILVPVYNASAYIERCAHSLFSQTFKDIEYIFVDDCSPDDSINKLKNILGGYPGRTNSVRIIKHSKNSGISAARQTAFDAATGNYLLAMDSDDYIETNTIELLYNKAIETNADIVFCDYYSEFAGDKQILRHANFYNSKIELLDSAIQGHSAYWNKLIARRIYTEHNIRTLSGVDHGDDLLVIAKVIYYSERFSYLQKPLYHYVEYNTSSTTKKFKPKYIEDRLKLVAELDTFFSSKADFKLYEPSIWLLKAIRKIRLLRLTKGNNTFIDLFPEINPHIGRLNIPFKSKLILWLAVWRNEKLLKLFMKTLQCFSKP